MSLILGFDTSCYTTSLACTDEKGIVLDRRTVLSVPLGGRGLRQSDALFQHNRNMPALLDELFSSVDPSSVRAVGVSTRPVDEVNSYMPVFLAGRLTARSVAGALRVPLIETTHQMGHVRAALFGGNEDLVKKGRFVAMHISGGTTDILDVTADGEKIVSLKTLGSCDDLHAGQMVDRVAVALGLAFPGGPHLEELASGASLRDIRIPSHVEGMHCSLSGAESALQRLIRAEANDPREIAYAVYDLLARTVFKLMSNASTATGSRQILLSGGVASSGLLRRLLSERNKEGLDIRFGRPELSSDNAVGVSLTAGDLM